jgi:carboxypeptidase Taq
MAAHQADSYQTWTAARPENDFAAVQPYLEKTLELSRRYADFFPGYEHVADPLIDVSDYGMKVSLIRPLFAALREQLVPIAEAITSEPLADDSFLHQRYPEAQQWKFGLDAAQRIGYDFARGRLDKTHHPFSTKFSIGDVRITTRSSKISCRRRSSPRSTRPDTPCTSKGWISHSRARR